LFPWDGTDNHLGKSVPSRAPREELMDDVFQGFEMPFQRDLGKQNKTSPPSTSMI